jgi:hypothetical protein
MFWVALSMVIMSFTGKGDDTAAFRKYLDTFHEALTAEVKDPARQKQALSAIDYTRAGFRTMRVDLEKVAKCIEHADRQYQVSRDDYERCLTSVDSVWQAAIDTLVSARDLLRLSVTKEEYAAVARRMAKTR